jgi:hypothetical protein
MTTTHYHCQCSRDSEDILVVLTDPPSQPSVAPGDPMKGRLWTDGAQRVTTSLSRDDK